MTDIDFQPSGLASLRVIRQVKAVLPKAVDAVESHLVAEVPPLTVVIAGRLGMTTAQILAAGWRAVAAGWRDTWREDRDSIACTSVTHTDRILIALNSRALRTPEEVWPTLVHELVHAVQMTRTGRREELRAILDHNLRITAMPDGLRHVMEAVTAIEEAEAYAIEAALTPDPEPQAPFDRTDVFHRLLSAVSHWEAAAERLPLAADTPSPLGGTP